MSKSPYSNKSQGWIKIHAFSKWKIESLAGWCRMVWHQKAKKKKDHCSIDRSGGIATQPIRYKKISVFTSSSKSIYSKETVSFLRWRVNETLWWLNEMNKTFQLHRKHWIKVRSKKRVVKLNFDSNFRLKKTKNSSVN